MSVWILWHIPPEAVSSDDMLIGVYSSRGAAAAAVGRLTAKPGFADHPNVVDETDEPGFFIEEHPLDKDGWTDGYREEGLPAWVDPAWFDPELPDKTQSGDR